MTDNSLKRFSGNSQRLAQQRRQARRRFGTTTAILGDSNGIVSTPSDPIGMVRVRFDGSSDSNGNATKTAYTLVHSGVTANYLPDAGRRVIIGLDYYGRKAILSADPVDLETAGIDPRVFNPSRRENNFISLRDVTRLMSRPVGTINTASTLVNVQPAIFDFYNERVVYRGTELQADKVDLSSLVPSTGYYRIAIVWVSLLDQTAYTSASDAQTIATAFDASDFEEAFLDRPFEAVPVQAYVLSNAQTSVDASAMYEDLRQFLNTPPRIGFPSLIQYRENIRTNYKQLTFGTITLENTLQIDGVMTTI